MDRGRDRGMGIGIGKGIRILGYWDRNSGIRIGIEG